MTLLFEFDPPPSRKVNVPQTSRDANDSIKEHKTVIYDKIVKALEEMKVGGTSEQIADFIGIEHSKVWKRLSELCDTGVVFNTGQRRLTKSNRPSMVRQLTRLKN